MYDIKNLKADLPLTMDMRVKELESTVEELQSELTVKSTEMDRLKNESKLLVAKFCQSKYQSNVNEDNSAQSSESTIVDTLKQDLEVGDKIESMHFIINSKNLSVQISCILVCSINKLLAVPSSTLNYC